MDKYKLVPVFPTEEMLEAGHYAMVDGYHPGGVYRTMLAAAPAVHGEPIGWYTEDHLDDKSATTYSAEVAQRWRDKGWPVWPLYTTPQLAEQKSTACVGCEGAPASGNSPCAVCGQKSVLDVSELVEALEALLEVRVVKADVSYGLACAKAEQALAAYRKAEARNE